MYLLSDEMSTAITLPSWPANVLSGVQRGCAQICGGGTKYSIKSANKYTIKLAIRFPRKKKNNCSNSDFASFGVNYAFVWLWKARVLFLAEFPYSVIQATVSQISRGHSPIASLQPLSLPLFVLLLSSAHTWPQATNSRPTNTDGFGRC